MSVTEEKVAALEAQALAASDQVRAAKSELAATKRQLQETERARDALQDKADGADSLAKDLALALRTVKAAEKRILDLERELETQTKVADAGRAVAKSLEILSSR